SVTLDQYSIDLVGVVHVPLPQGTFGRGWRKLRPRVALSVGLAWRFASASGGENVGPGTSGVAPGSADGQELWSTSSSRERIINSPRPALLIFTIYFRPPMTSAAVR